MNAGHFVWYRRTDYAGVFKETFVVIDTVQHEQQSEWFTKAAAEETCAELNREVTS